VKVYNSTRAVESKDVGRCGTSSSHSSESTNEAILSRFFSKRRRPRTVTRLHKRKNSEGRKGRHSRQTSGKETLLVNSADLEEASIPISNVSSTCFQCPEKAISLSNEVL